VLGQEGWQVAAAAHPDAAVTEMAAMQEDGRLTPGEMPVALVSDHRLGLNVNGLQVLDQLRYEFGEDLPALLLTGEMPAELAEAAAAAGVQLVSKPIDADGLIALLNRATNGA
jgi:CheY-like chemotaxis protein